MKISSKFVGARLKEYKTVVRWQDCMNYAAAIDDNNPYYFNDEQDGGIVAPPMLSVALTWAISQNLQNFIDTDNFPFEIIERQVHYSQHLEFHAPIKPSDELTINGVIVAILPTRSGTHLVIKYEAVNQLDEPIFTEYIGGMLRGVSCDCEENDGKTLGDEALPSVPAFKDSDNLKWEKSVWIDPLRPYIYDACAKVHFPIHTSRKFAHKVGLPNIILQGTATLAFVARELVNKHADGKPEKLKTLNCRFTGMVFPDSTIKIQLCTIENKSDCSHLFFKVVDANGHSVISKGYAKISHT